MSMSTDISYKPLDPASYIQNRDPWPTYGGTAQSPVPMTGIEIDANGFGRSASGTIGPILNYGT